MGFFSWLTSDTNRSISNSYSPRGALDCFLVTPDNDYIHEGAYDGYGEFGGYDAHALLARWNKPEECNGDDEHDRIIGIRLECGVYNPETKQYEKEEIKFPLKFVEIDEGLDYDKLPAAKSCPDQGYFYSGYDDAWDDEWIEDDEDEE